MWIRGIRIIDFWGALIKRPDIKNTICQDRGNYEHVFFLFWRPAPPHLLPTLYQTLESVTIMTRTV